MQRKISWVKQCATIVNDVKYVIFALSDTSAMAKQFKKLGIFGQDDSILETPGTQFTKMLLSYRINLYFYFIFIFVLFSFYYFILLLFLICSAYISVLLDN